MVEAVGGEDGMSPGAWMSRVPGTACHRLHYVLPDDSAACAHLLMANGEPRNVFKGPQRWERPRAGERKCAFCMLALKKARGAA